MGKKRKNTITDGGSTTKMGQKLVKNVSKIVKTKIYFSQKEKYIHVKYSFLHSFAYGFVIGQFSLFLNLQSCPRGLKISFWNISKSRKNHVI